MEITWKESKGKQFENLVGALLKHMFPDMVFKQTNYVHDGGKDFYSVGSRINEKIWIEAKNYSNRLELSKFANTFIMADISEINRIIIFSMSELTKGTKINIARYAAFHKKIISVYAGSDIVFLIRKYKDTIPMEKYMENSKEVLATECENSNTNDLLVAYEYYSAKQYNLTYRRDSENHIKKSKLNTLPLHSLIAQEIYITNHNLFQSKVLNPDYSEYESSYIEANFYGEKPSVLVIPPASTYVIAVFFKIAEMCATINLPMVHFNDNNIVTDCSVCRTECCWLGEIPYMGKSWETLQNTIHSLERNKDKKYIVIKGKSGVGKTRFLQELAGNYFSQGYRIISLDFRSMTDLSLKNALRNILNNIYILDDDSDQKAACIKEFGDLYNDFYDILFDGNYNCSNHIDRICSLLISFINRQHIMLLIDNMQDISSETAEFFEKLMSTVNNQGNITSLITLCFNVDFLGVGKTATKLLAYLEQLNGSIVAPLEDFDEGDAKIYLRNCLDPCERRPDLEQYYVEIIQNFGKNPFVLKQLMLYLKQRGIIAFDDSMVYLSDFDNMKIVLSELPQGVNNILQVRYQYLLRTIHTCTEKDLNRIIWCILFLGSLNRDILLRTRLNMEGLKALLDYGFVEYNEKSDIIFCHQLIEKSFCLFFMKTKYVKNPSVVFIEDEEFLQILFNLLKRIGRINLCVEIMLLQTRLDQIDTDDFNRALECICRTSPRAVMIPLVIKSILECLNCGVKAIPSLEFKASYELGIACQERFDVYTAAKYTEDLILYEQATYMDKLEAADDMLKFFKNYVFQLPITKKYPFLNWLLDNRNNFGLQEDVRLTFLGWIQNRYSKNLCSEHRFKEAEVHIREALKIALDRNDFCAAAEAEIEYGNIFAYDDTLKTIEHWEQCVNYITECGNNSIYFQVYRRGYYILVQLLKNNVTEDLSLEIVALQELRTKTFLYQKLFIDDVCTDYYIIQYLDTFYGNSDYLRDIIASLNRMKSESYMHTLGFTILATYKLFTVYDLLCDIEDSESNIDIATSYMLELIENKLFEKEKLIYSRMVLQDMVLFCQKHNNIKDKILQQLPDDARKIFANLSKTNIKRNTGYALTPISNQSRKVNLPYFNYGF